LREDFTTGQLELFDLVQDVGERQDLSAKLTEKTRELHAKLQAWRESLGVKPVAHLTGVKPVP